MAFLIVLIILVINSSVINSYGCAHPSANNLDNLANIFEYSDAGIVSYMLNYFETEETFEIIIENDEIVWLSPPHYFRPNIVKLVYQKSKCVSGGLFCLLQEALKTDTNTDVGCVTFSIDELKARTYEYYLLFFIKFNKNKTEYYPVSFPLLNFIGETKTQILNMSSSVLQARIAKEQIYTSKIVQPTTRKPFIYNPLSLSKNAYPLKPQIEVPQIEVPQIEVPQIEVPQIEVPQIEVPQIEVPQIEVPQVEYSPQVEDSLKAENYYPQAPKAEIYVSEDYPFQLGGPSPKVKDDGPKAEIPLHNYAPKVKDEGPKAEEPKVEYYPFQIGGPSPKVKDEGPKAERPKVEYSPEDYPLQVEKPRYPDTQSQVEEVPSSKIKLVCSTPKCYMGPSESTMEIITPLKDSKFIINPREDFMFLTIFLNVEGCESYNRHFIDISSDWINTLQNLEINYMKVNGNHTIKTTINDFSNEIYNEFINNPTTCGEFINITIFFRGVNLCSIMV